MGFIRGTAVTFFSIVLLLSLFLMTFTLTISWSMEYKTLQPALKSSASDFLKTSFDIDSAFAGNEQFMQSACLIQDKFTFTEQGYTFEIPCEIMQNGKEAVINYGVDSLIQKVYYDKYDCEIWDCIKQSEVPFVLFSEKAMNYWREKFVIFTALSVILFLLIFLISKNRPMIIFFTGLFIILAALPFRKLNWVLGLIPKDFTGLFSVFFTKASNVFVIMLILGLIFMGIGLTFRFSGISLRFAKSEEEAKDGISKSEVREIVKEEMSKTSKDNSKAKPKKK